MFYTLIPISALLIFFVRKLWIKKKTFSFIYYILLIGILLLFYFSLTVVIGDQYTNLDKFLYLEKTHQLQEAKQNPASYDPEFQIDLDWFENSAEFAKYIKEGEIMRERIEPIFFGSLLALIILITTAVMKCFYNNKRNKL